MARQLDRLPLVMSAGSHGPGHKWGEERLAAERFVLLVDDDPAMSDMYGMGLQHHGFRVAVLQAPTRLNETVAADPPDIVVLDWEMPALRGDEALERLRKTDAGRTVPV